MVQQENKEIQSTRYNSTHLALTTTTERERERERECHKTPGYQSVPLPRTTLSSTKVASV